MMQNKHKGRFAGRWKIFLPTALFLVSFEISAAFAQTLPPVDPESLEADEIAGTPVEEMISALEGGGLSTTQDLGALKPVAVEQAPDSAAAPEEDQPVIPDPPAFDPDLLKNLESQGGLSTSPQIDAGSPSVFKLAAKFLERVVFHNDVEFMKRPTFDKGMDISGTPTFGRDTAGYAVIKKGNQSVVVDFDKDYDSPPVVTVTLSVEQYDDPEVRAVAQDLLLVSDVKYIVSRVSKKSFEIMMDRKADSDIPFSWHALAVNKPKTAKKKGNAIENGPTAEPDLSGNRTTDSIPVENAGDTSSNQPLTDTSNIIPLD